MVAWFLFEVGTIFASPEKIVKWWAFIIKNGVFITISFKYKNKVFFWVKNSGMRERIQIQNSSFISDKGPADSGLLEEKKGRRWRPFFHLQTITLYLFLVTRFSHFWLLNYLLEITEEVDLPECQFETDVWSQGILAKSTKWINATNPTKNLVISL